MIASIARSCAPSYSSISMGGDASFSVVSRNELMPRRGNDATTKRTEGIVLAQVERMARASDRCALPRRDFLIDWSALLEVGVAA